MKKIITIIALGLSLGAPVWASGAAANPPSPRAAAKDAAEAAARDTLSALQNAYTSGDLQGFFKLVSGKAYFNDTDLRFKLTGEFDRHEPIDLQFFVDSAVTDLEKVSLGTHWQKRSLDARSGQVVPTQGKADFIFHVNKEGKAKLLDIRGDSPF